MSNLEEHIRKQRDALDDDAPNLWHKIQAKLDDEAIEEAIAGHREALNSEMPSPQVWQRIEERLEGKSVRMVPMRRVWQVAASVAILMGAVFAWQLSRMSQAVPQTATADWRPQVPELASAEVYYHQVISEKRQELQQYDAKKFGLEQQNFDKELHQLDSAYKQLEHDLLSSQRDERIVSAMIENLQMRMHLLNTQLSIMQQLQQQQKVVSLETSI